MFRTAMGLIKNTPAFKAGHKAGETGKPASANPYTAGSGHCADWELGWHFGAREKAANQNRAAVNSAPEATPFELGALAAADGFASTSNPFHFGHPSHAEWRRGWAHRKAS